jgi:hypothetical protein
MPRGVLAWSQAVRRMRTAWLARQISGQTIGWYQAGLDPAKNPAGFAHWKADLAGLKHLAGGQMALVLYPLLVGFDRQYPLAAAHRTMARLAEEAGVPVLDLAEVFAGQRPEDLWVHPVDHHPNGRAHGLAARAIAAWLAQQHPEFLRKQPPAEAEAR